MPKENKAKVTGADLLEKADAAARDGKAKIAIKFYKQYLQLEPDDSSVMVKIGGLFEKSKEYRSAEEWYGKATALDGKAINYVKLARAQNGCLDHDAALVSIREALKLQPEDELAHEVYLYTLGECDHAPELRPAAERLLAINPQNLDGLSYLGKALMLDKDFEGAEKALTKALEIDPDSALAHLHMGLLKIEQLHFEAGMNFLEKSHSIYARAKNRSQMDYIASIYHYYKTSSSSAKRCSAFGGMTVEKQIAVLESCGIKLKDGFSCAEFLSGAKIKRSAMEVADPFNTLLYALAGGEWILNAESFDDECIEQSGDYKRFAEMFRRLAQGAFPLEDCDDTFDWGESDEAKGVLSLSFKLHGKEYIWRPRVKDDWLDWGILRKLGKLAIASGDGICFIAPTGDSLVICLKSDQVETFRQKTLIEFEILGK